MRINTRLNWSGCIQAMLKAEIAPEELPEAMTWLWRGYDPAKTADTFPPDPDEKNKPFFRVKQFNR